MDDRLSQEATSFVQQYHTHWNKIRDPQTLGVLIFIQLIAVPENHNMITNCRFLVANNIVAADSERGKLFKSIAQVLGPALLGTHGGNLTSGST